LFGSIRNSDGSLAQSPVDGDRTAHQLPLAGYRNASRQSPMPTRPQADALRGSLDLLVLKTLSSRLVIGQFVVRGIP
jgi:hypothetical protein